MTTNKQDKIDRILAQLAQMNADERIEHTYNEISRIAGEPPTTIIMNTEFFTRWYKYCEEQGIDYTHWRDVPIFLEEKSPAQIAVSYHLHLPKTQKI